MADDDADENESGGQPRAPTSSRPPIVRLLERESDPGDVEVARRLRRESSDPTLLIARLIRAIEHDRESSDSALHGQLEQAIRSQDKAIAKMQADIDALKVVAHDARSGIRWGKVLGGFAIGIAISIGGFVANRMLSGEELKGEYRVRLDHLEKAVEWLTRQPKDRP